MTPPDQVYACPHCGKKCPCLKNKFASVVQPEDISIRYLPLTKGLFAIVDAEDFERLSTSYWSVTWNMKGRYSAYYGAKNEVFPDGKRRIVKLHRFIMGLNLGDKRVVDHINGNTLNNRKINLRVCSVAENARNRHPRSNILSLRYSGVTEATDIGFGFDVHVKYNNLRVHVGWRETKEEADVLFSGELKKYENIEE